MKNQLKVMMMGMSVLVSMQVSAQDFGGRNGGDLTEVNFKNYMNKIADFIVTPEGQKAYPTIDGTSFRELVSMVHPVVKAEAVTDSMGNSRSCVSGSKLGVLYTQCDSKKLPLDTLENRPAIYRIIFHELLVHAKKENPVNIYIPSEYPLSSSIAEYMKLVVNYEWNLGAKDELNLIQAGFSCEQDRGIREADHFGDRVQLRVNTKGEYWLFQYNVSRPSANSTEAFFVSKVKILGSGQLDYSATSFSDDFEAQSQIKENNEGKDLRLQADFSIAYLVDKVSRNQSSLFSLDVSLGTFTSPFSPPSTYRFMPSQFKKAYYKMLCRPGTEGYGEGDRSVQESDLMKLLESATANTEFPFHR